MVGRNCKNLSCMSCLCQNVASVHSGRSIFMKSSLSKYQDAEINAEKYNVHYWVAGALHNHGVPPLDNFVRRKRASR